MCAANISSFSENKNFSLMQNELVTRESLQDDRSAGWRLRQLLGQRASHCSLLSARRFTEKALCWSWTL